MLPAFPRQENLIEFFVSAASDWRFFVDAASVNVEQGVVRYTVVARHPDGGQNIAYEALWCERRQYRTYASGRRDGTWSPRLTPWRDYPRLSPTSWQHALGKEYFCPYVRSPVGSTKEAVDALRNGGHPAVKGR
jgi:hypothetical protein